MAFEYREFLPGIWHIRDVMGVCCTLLNGQRAALLVDTGYGLENTWEAARAITGPDKPLQVLLTHAHHDHALGCRWFDQVYLHPDDAAVWRTYTNPFWREHVLRGAEQKGLKPDREAYLASVLPDPRPIPEGDMDLGGLTARVLPCPGHTPGSVAVFVPERAILLTGDSWNPCTWLFFPEALGAGEYRRNLRALLELPFEQVLCSHQYQLYGRDSLEAFALGLTDECLGRAVETPVGKPYGVYTREASPAPGQVLVFARL